MENVREELLNWIGLTVLLISVFAALIIQISWDLGADYKMLSKSKARRLNCLEKFFNGLHIFLKM